MSLVAYLRMLLTADRGRWIPMLGGLGVAIAAAEVVVLLDPPGPVTALLVLVVIAAWSAGACAMVGYVRWFFAEEVARARREEADAAKRKDK